VRSIIFLNEKTNCFYYIDYINNLIVYIEKIIDNRIYKKYNSIYFIKFILFAKNLSMKNIIKLIITFTFHCNNINFYN
jgi:hypothetical protein